MFDEVARTLRCRNRDDEASTLGQVITQLLHGSGSETARDDFAQPGVLRGVHVEQN